mgnify:CR=1 FL=1
MGFMYEFPHSQTFDSDLREILERFMAVVGIPKEFEELKKFVTEYFDNLDVSKEINAKIDAMIADGTLQEIISQYVNHLQTYQSIINSDVDYLAGTNFMILFGANAFPFTVTDSEQDISYPLHNGKYITYSIGKQEQIDISVLGGFSDLSDKMQALLNVGYINFYLPKGIYTLSLDLPAYAKIRGDIGAHVSVTSKNGSYIFKLTGDNIRLENLYLFGAKESNISGLKSDIGSGSSFSEFRNLHFNGLYMHMDFQGSHIWCRFDGCRMESAGYASMFVRGTNTTFFNNNSFMNCRFNNNNTPINIDLQAINCFSISFYSCNIEYNSGSLNITGTCAFYGCYFEGNAGLTVTMARAALFSGTCFINENNLITTTIALGKKTFISCWNHNSTNIYDNVDNVEKLGCNF